MAGIGGDVELEDALGIVSFMVSAGRIPAPAHWVDSLAQQAELERARAQLESSLRGLL
jgi:hypothetical protein